MAIHFSSEYLIAHFWHKVIPLSIFHNHRICLEQLCVLQNANIILISVIDFFLYIYFNSSMTLSFWNTWMPLYFLLLQSKLVLNFILTSKIWTFYLASDQAKLTKEIRTDIQYHTCSFCLFWHDVERSRWWATGVWNHCSSCRFKETDNRAISTILRR